MARWLFQWNRRLLSLGTGAMLCLSVGCVSTKDDRKGLATPTPLTKTMGPGNSAAPVSPAYSNLAAGPAGTNPTTQYSQAAMSPPQSAQPPAMPTMPTMPTMQTAGGRPSAMQGGVQMPVNTLQNPASFQSPASVPNNATPPANYGMPQVQPAYNMQQPAPIAPTSPAPVGYQQPQQMQPMQQGMPAGQPAPQQFQVQQGMMMPQPVQAPAVNNQNMPGIMLPGVPTQAPPMMTPTPVSPMPAMPPMSQSNTAPRQLPNNVMASSDPRGVQQASLNQSISFPTDPASSSGPTAGLVAGTSMRAVTTDPSMREPVMPAPITVSSTTTIDGDGYRR